MDYNINPVNIAPPNLITAMDQANMYLGGRQLQQQNQLDAARLKVAQDAAQSQNALIQPQQNPAQAQPQGQNALNPRQAQVPVPQNYAEVVAQHEEQDRKIVAQQQRQNDMIETMNYGKLDEPLLAQFTDNRNVAGINALADKRMAEGIASGNTTLQDYGEAMHGNKIAKGIMSVTPFPITALNSGDALFKMASPEDKDYMAERGVYSGSDLVGKRVSYDANIKDKHHIPGSFRIEEPTEKEAHELQVVGAKAEVASKLDTQKAKERTEAATAKYAEDEKKLKLKNDYTTALQQSGFKFRAGESSLGRAASIKRTLINQAGADRRNSTNAQFKNLRSVVQAPTNALTDALKQSNRAEGFEDKLRLNTALVRKGMKAYIAKHPEARGRIGAVYNDFVNGKLGADSDLANIRTGLTSISNERARLETGAFTNAATTRSAMEEFGTIKPSAGFDNVEEQLQGTESLVENAVAAQQGVTNRAIERVNEARQGAGFGDMGLTEPVTAPTSTAGFGGPPAIAAQTLEKLYPQPSATPRRPRPPKAPKTAKDYLSSYGD